MYHYIENPPLVDSLSIRNIYNRKNLVSREYRGNNSLDDPIELIEKLSIGIEPEITCTLGYKLGDLSCYNPDQNGMLNFEVFVL